MTYAHAVKVTGTGLPGGTTIEVDGVPVENATAAVRIDPGDKTTHGQPVVTIRLIPALYLDLDVDPAQVVLDDLTVEALRLMGWCRPEDVKATWPARSTPAEVADCDEVIDSRGKTWRYSQPGDVWRLLALDGGGSRPDPHSARSYQRLLAEFGPLADAGSR